MPVHPSKRTALGTQKGGNCPRRGDVLFASSSNQPPSAHRKRGRDCQNSVICCCGGRSHSKAHYRIHWSLPSRCATASPHRHLHSLSRSSWLGRAASVPNCRKTESQPRSSAVFLILLQHATASILHLTALAITLQLVETHCLVRHLNAAWASSPALWPSVVLPEPGP